jgi:hypothetical protein
MMKLLKTFAKKPQNWALVAAVLVVSGSVLAVSVTHTFQANTPARAAEVNKNFTDLVTAINDLEVTLGEQATALAAQSAALTAANAEITALKAKYTFTGSLTQALSGTVAVNINSTAVTGTGTQFSTQLAIGDAIKIGTEVFTVAAITSNTTLTLNRTHPSGVSNVVAYTDPKLFAINNGAGVEKISVDKGGSLKMASGTSIKGFLAGCKWTNTTNTSSRSAEATCPAGYAVLTGGCVLNASTLGRAVPTTASSSYPSAGSSGDITTKFYCENSTNDVITAYALCCPN